MADIRQEAFVRHFSIGPLGAQGAHDGGIGDSTRSSPEARENPHRRHREEDKADENVESDGENLV